MSKTAVIPATNLDAAFFNSIDKQIKTIIDAIDNINRKEGKIFNKFISKLVPKIKEKELQNINQQLKEYKLKQEILEEIKNFNL